MQGTGAYGKDYGRQAQKFQQQQERPVRPKFNLGAVTSHLNIGPKAAAQDEPKAPAPSPPVNKPPGIDRNIFSAVFSVPGVKNLTDAQVLERQKIKDQLTKGYNFATGKITVAAPPAGSSTGMVRRYFELFSFMFSASGCFEQRAFFS